MLTFLAPKLQFSLLQFSLDVIVENTL